MGLTFEVAFSAPPTAEPGPGDWTDLSADLAGMVTVSAGSPQGGGWDSHADLQLDDRQRAYDPTGNSATAGKLMAHARLTADGSPVYRGLVDTWHPLWQAGSSKVSIRLIDGLAWIALQDTVVELPEETTGQRINRILDLAGWPAARRNIDEGLVTVAARELDGANLRRLVEDAADAEDGFLYVDPAGDVVFHDRHHRFASSPELTVASNGPRDLTLADKLEPKFDVEGLVTIARVEQSDGTTRTHADAAAVAAYGPRTLTVRDLDLVPSRPEGVALAEWAVHRYAEPIAWANPVHIDALENLPAVLTRRTGDLIRVRHTPPAGGPAYDVVGHLEQIVHTIAASAWRTSWSLSPYFGGGPWMALDDPVLGLLDSTNKLAP